MATKTAKKPSGLSITRNGSKFTLSWKIKEQNCTYQTLQVLYARSFDSSGSPHWEKNTYWFGNAAITHKGRSTSVLNWRDISIGKKATSKTITPPATVVALSFRICCGGEYKKKGSNRMTPKQESEWVYESFISTEPKSPSVSMSVVNDMTSTFSWKSEAPAAGTKIFVENQWQHILAASNTADGSKVTGSWSSIGSTSASGSWTKEESGWDIRSQSKTRWVRVRSKGRDGLISPWRYARRVYAYPAPATNVKATRSAFANSGYAVSVTWSSPETQARPIDTASVEYVKTVPVVTVTQPASDSGTVKMNMSCPASGITWSSERDTGGASGNRAVAFTDPDAIPKDECMYVRISNKHDNNVTVSTPVLVSGGVGNLISPSVPSAEPTSTPRLYSIAVSQRGTAIENAAIAIYFRTTSEQNKSKCIGIIAPGESQTTCIIPTVADGDTFAFGARAFIGNYTPKAPSSLTEVTEYTVAGNDDGILMTSETVWGDAVPLPPTVSADSIDESTIEVSWNWSWTDATQAELSWSDHKDAWESTDEPQTYIVNSTSASHWRIAGLSIGTWYVRVRLLKVVGESVSYSAYSSLESGIVKLSSSPDIPSLLVSPSVVSKTGSIECYWAYVSGDGTGQKQAQICEAIPHYDPVTSPTGDPYDNMYYERTGDSEENYKYTRSFDREVETGKTYYQMNGEVTYGEVVPGGTVGVAQHASLLVEDLGWLPGETHHLSVRVMSMSMESSNGWSTPVPVTVADEPYIRITSTSLTPEDIPADYDEDGNVTETRPQLSLTRFPLEINVDGFSAGDTLTCIIDRAKDYHIDRPDDSEYDGFAGETVLMKSYQENQIQITQEDLIGAMDDGASYRITLILNDSYGQNVETSELLPNIDSFEVHWEHQAVMPSAEIEADHDANVTFITPIRPETGFDVGDVVDIYRLSADVPELIYAGAALTDPPTKYVDPYPAFGQFGGHRIVYRTYNGDYITRDNELAITNYTAEDEESYAHTRFGIVIDFGQDQIILPGNVSFSSKWSKDFEITKYLGGSVQGDWNPAVERSMSAKVTIPVEYETENIELIRKLAVYPGVCHVRTPDGSSFAANIDVNDDREEKWTRRVAQVSLDITRCDPEGNEGMTYEDWIKTQE